ncbi:MAG: UDP-3-O-acyl-N-acetylglucosamine deacetylase [Polyangiaceae bacterium]
MLLKGRALHSGATASIALTTIDARSCLAAEGVSAALGSLEVVRTDLGVCVSLSSQGPKIDLVEHVAAALGGLWMLDGVRIEVEGPEPPLLDGGARELSHALLSMGVTPSESRMSVTRAWSFAKGDSVYELLPAHETTIDVTIEFAHAAIGRQSARWSGDRDEFVREIAPARTFGFLKDAEKLRAAGRAAFVDTASVVVLDERGPIEGELQWANEPARHKLLDLIGDITLRGGPFRGVVRALRPGHTATHAMIDAAVREGAIAFA